MNNIKQKFSALLLVSLCFSLSGCWFALGGAAGGGAALYFKGRLQENVDYDMQTVHEAARRALHNLDLPVHKEEKKVESTSFESKYPDGTHVWINTEYISTNSTQVTIRVGVTGDEHRARQIWDAIRRQLG